MSTTLKDNDSDSDVEFEDVPLPTATNDTPSLRPSLQRAEWTPTLYLPQQRDVPIPHGSEEETQLRDRLSHGIDRINYRRMKADMDMDAPGTRASLRRYESFKELAGDVEHLVDMLWVSATRKFFLTSSLDHFGKTWPCQSFIAIYFGSFQRMSPRLTQSQPQSK